MWSQVALASLPCGPVLELYIPLCSVSCNQAPLFPQAVTVCHHYLWVHTKHSIFCFELFKVPRLRPLLPYPIRFLTVPSSLRAYYLLILGSQNFLESVVFADQLLYLFH